jgi:hypothetical protein
MKFTLDLVLVFAEGAGPVHRVVLLTACNSVQWSQAPSRCVFLLAALAHSLRGVSCTRVLRKHRASNECCKSFSNRYTSVNAGTRCC